MLLVIQVIFVCMIILGAFTLTYQIFRLTALDAKCRGFKHPGFWGIFSAGGGNSGGLLLYLIGRRKYPVSMNDAEKAIMDSRKKRAGVSLCFIASGALGALITALFF